MKTDAQLIAEFLRKRKREKKERVTHTPKDYLIVVYNLIVNDLHYQFDDYQKAHKCFKHFVKNGSQVGMFHGPDRIHATEDFPYTTRPYGVKPKKPIKMVEVGRQELNAWLTGRR